MSTFARVTRGPITESRHDGVIVVVDSTGQRLAHFGNPNLVTFARSSCKPIQAIPTVESGAIERFHLATADIALFCASHSSEDIHTNRVQSILDTIGLDASLLICGAHPPHSRSTYEDILRSGGELTSIHSNCSGKHTGMLTYCAHTGAHAATYAELNHPLQQEILDVLAELAEVDKQAIVLGVDGCGVPVHALSMEQWARAFAKFTDPERFPHADAMRIIASAMRSYPELVGGSTGRFDTDLMKATNGRIMAKGGAEGFMMVSVMDAKYAVVMKVFDGNSRAIPPVMIQTLTELGALTSTELDNLAHYVESAIQNTRDAQVGKIVADFVLERG